MKKILTILLTGFMMLCSFTVKVNAETIKASKTIIELFENITGGFPTTEEDAWVNENGLKIYLSGNTLVTPDWEINANAKNILDYDLDTGIYSYDASLYTLIFVRNSNFQVEYIDIVNAQPLYKNDEGRYKSPLPTFLDILPGNFPKSLDGSVPANVWLRQPNEDSYLYADISSGKLVIADKNNPLYPATILLSSKLYKVSDDEYRNYYSSYLFKLENGVLKSISISGTYQESEWMYGTYTAPKTVKDITIDVPYGYDYGWINENGQRAYIYDETLKVGNSIIGLINPVEKVDGNYQYVDNYGTNYTFNMQDNELISIVVTNNTSSLEDNGTYVPPLSIKDILPEDFPTTRKTAWVSSYGNIVYTLGGTLYFSFDSDMSSSSWSMDYPVYKDDDGNYTCEQNVVVFYMENGLLKSVSMNHDDILDIFAPYASLKNIDYKDAGDILFTINIQYGTPTKSTIEIDGKTLTQDSEYTINYNQPTTVTLLKNYIKTLTDGSHTLSVTVDEYKMKDIVFNVSNSKPEGGGSSHYTIPKTGIK